MAAGVLGEKRTVGTKTHSRRFLGWLLEGKRVDQVLRKGDLVYFGNKINRLEKEKDSINPCFHKCLVTKCCESLAHKCAVLLHVCQTNGGTLAKIKVGESPVSLDR